MTTTTTTTTADLLNAVLASDNLRRAWARVKSNHGAPGMDGVTIEDFPAGSRAHWPALRQQIASGRYQSQPVRRVDIPKPGGGTRLLGIRTVMDRVIQQAIAQVLTPLFDPGFSASSFGFRPGRNAHQAIRQVQGLVTHGYRWAVDLDLAKFFDTVNHDQLMARPARVFTDRRLLALLGRSLRARVQVCEHHIEPSEVGTPQGGPLSPLLANILLDAFDTELHRRGHRFARYADDVVILVRSQRAGERVMRSLTQYLHTRLKLSVNPAKSRVALMSDCSFLTFTIKGKKIRWADSALLAFKHRGEELTGRSWGVSMVHRLKKLAPYLRGWFGYFGIS
jgi:RNA-directed DNA polymerase